jgi:hypothetical protein
MKEIGALLGFIGGFTLDTGDLDKGWEKLKMEITGLIENNSELLNIVDRLRKIKVRGSVRKINQTGTKVINFQDFLKPD